jgi:hypothetical protein
VNSARGRGLLVVAPRYTSVLAIMGEYMPAIGSWKGLPTAEYGEGSNER